ncbi:von Willebrand factor A domain-containing protein 5A-like isoform X4 [Sinocyclocheilus rhinocerous]|uniref:von Willebrand factor A domain-containing protein 5A-like isoform X4 n=1 Tax=Sinocyclocheilus rhinocerous TaxID=307959 RepID=UPI0007B96C79|nr:PREDICTED: von Willebrand factor A domain-containing protein 5A-like isoform X4 [Sinocyclocheilus rhinocerous]
MVNCCGLVTEKNEPVPLKSISVELQVQDHVASVRSCLQYVNEEQRPLEAVFVFPLPADAAVCHFSARIGEQEIRAELQDRQSARDQYDDAVSSGQQAFLLEESEESSDVFRLSVGCLSPGQNASISIVYIIELSIQADHALRFCLPAVLNPRYTPAASAAGVPEVSSASVIPYTLSLSVEVRSSDCISRLESSCALDPLEFLDAQHTHATVNLSAGHRFEKDVELFLYYENSHQPSAVVEAAASAAQSGSLMGDPALMISLYPEFPADVMSSLASQGEFIFVVDRSGSMDCKMHHGNDAQMRIESARDTLLLLLKSLPMGCYFNIYGFGSHFESFFPQSVVYSEDTMEEALKRVKSMSADMGGTEILQPLKHIYSQPCYPDHPRQLFIFTDGEVWNTKEVLDLVKSHVYSHRCFSFGIGEGASTALITGMAREGSGHAQFITGTDRMQPKVMQSLRFALQPAVDNISVDWTVPEGVTVDMLSPPINTLFQGQRALIYAQIKGQSSGQTEGAVMVKYRLKDQPVTNQLQFTLKPTEDTGLTIHRLAARYVIRSLELEERAGGADAENIRRRIVELSVHAGVSSVHTAFIGVNKDSKQTVKGPLLQRRVPVALVGAAKRKKCSARTMAPQMAFGSLMLCARRSTSTRIECDSMSYEEEAEPQKDPLLQLVSLQKAAGCWELNASLAAVFGKTEDEVTNQKAAQVDGSVWATVLALIWLYAFKSDQQDEWQFVAMKAASWIRSQKRLCVCVSADGLSQCVCDGNVLLGCQVTEDMLGI